MTYLNSQPAGKTVFGSRLRATGSQSSEVRVWCTVVSCAVYIQLNGPEMKHRRPDQLSMALLDCQRLEKLVLNE